MRNIEDLKARMYALIDEVREMVKKAESESRALSAEEQEKRGRMMDEIRQYEKDIAEEEELQRIESARAKKPDPERDRYEWRSLGEFVRTVCTNPHDKRLSSREVEGPELRQSTQDMANDTQGGYLVPDQFSDQLLTVQPDEAIVRPRATVFGGNEADFKIPALQYHGENMYAGAEVTWIGEGAAKPQTDIVFRQITLQPYEVAAHVEVTDKLLRNSNIIEQVVRTQLRGALIDAEEDAFLKGSGSKPTGIIDADCTFGVTRADNSEVQYADVKSMYARFRGRRGVWIASREVLPELMAMKDDSDVLIWQPNARDGSPGNLLGMPVLFSDHSPAMNQTGSLLLCDLSYYLIKDGVGVAIAASPHFKFTNNITVIKAFKTVDGKPWLDNVLPTSYNTSPFVQIENQ